MKTPSPKERGTVPEGGINRDPSPGDSFVYKTAIVYFGGFAVNRRHTNIECWQ